LILVTFWLVFSMRLYNIVYGVKIQLIYMISPIFAKWYIISLEVR